MTEPYAQFDKTGDKAPIVTFDDIKVRLRNFKLLEIILAITTCVAVLVCVILAAVLANKNSYIENISSSTSALSGSNVCITSPCLKTASHVLQFINQSVDPCTNFYKYACGNFPRYYATDAETSSRTVYSIMYQENQDKLKKVLESPVERDQKWSFEKKLKDLFASCTNTYYKERAKGSPLINKVLPEIGGWYVLGTFDENTWDFNQALRKTHVDFWTRTPFFTTRIATDWYDRTKKVIEVDYSGMTMWYRYYTEPEDAKTRNDLKMFMRRVATFLVRDSNITIANDTETNRIETFINDTFEVETALANITANTLPTMDPHAEEKRLTVAQLTAKVNNAIDFTALLKYQFNTAGVNDNTKIILMEDDWLTRVADYINSLGSNKNRMLNNYIVWRLGYKYAQEMSWEYVHANREFYVDLYGVPNFLGTWLYCFYYMDRNLGDAFGSLYVKDHFADKNKEKVEEIVTYVKNTLINHTTNNAIFDKATKEAAQKKLRISTDKMGYPDFMVEESKMDARYGSLQIDSREDYFSNMLAVNKFERLDWNRQLTTGEDKSEWAFRTYDTYMSYSNWWNEMLVPAGLLQFPIYDYTLPHYMNFGSIGSLLGHYYVHGIDSWGAYYDEKGSFKNWWSNYTKTSFEKARKCIELHYTNMTMGPYTVPGNPEPVTVPVYAGRFANEGMAETSGVKIAYDAYRTWVQKNGAEKTAPGLSKTNDQMFFLGYAQSNCFSRNDNTAYYNAIRGRVSEDLRTNSVLSQLKEFSTAFNCPADSPMNAEQKCTLF